MARCRLAGEPLVTSELLDQSVYDEEDIHDDEGHAHESVQTEADSDEDEVAEDKDEEEDEAELHVRD